MDAADAIPQAVQRARPPLSDALRGLARMVARAGESAGAGPRGRIRFTSSPGWSKTYAPRAEAVLREKLTATTVGLGGMTAEEGLHAARQSR